MATRNTIQQRLIGEQLRQLGDHPTADEVYRAVAKERPSISKATVYRTLNKMADSGAATRVHVETQAEHFDHRCDPHYHVVCTVCGRVDDIEPDCVPDDFDATAVSGASGYVITGRTLQFRGVCPACQAAQDAQEKEVL